MCQSETQQILRTLTIIRIAVVFIINTLFLQRGRHTCSKTEKDLPSDCVMSNSTNSGRTSSMFLPVSPDPDVDGKMH